MTTHTPFKHASPRPGIIIPRTQRTHCSSGNKRTRPPPSVLGVRASLATNADRTPLTVSRPAWAATFPTSPAEVADIPQEWADALAIALADGSIPDIPPSTPTGGSPVYPADFDPKGDEVCSATYKCRNPADMWDAPDGVFGVSFDDGPLPVSTAPCLFQDGSLKPDTL